MQACWVWSWTVKPKIIILPSPPGVAWALCPTHHLSRTELCQHFSDGALRAKEMQCGRAGMDGLPENPPGALGGRARDAVTPSWLA